MILNKNQEKSFPCCNNCHLEVKNGCFLLVSGVNLYPLLVTPTPIGFDEDTHLSWDGSEGEEWDECMWLRVKDMHNERNDLW